MTEIDNIDTVLFDVGNVIASDYWEAMWLTANRGLADRLSLAPSAVADACTAAWDEFSIRIASENEYWEFCSDLLNISFGKDLIIETEQETIFLNQYAVRTMFRLTSQNKRIGIISNNTSFWYPKQILLSGTGSYIDRDLVFLSCNEFVTKSDGALFARAADQINPHKTLIIDDRISNIQRAKELNFKTFLFDRGAQNTIDTQGHFNPPPFCDFNIWEGINE